MRRLTDPRLGVLFTPAAKNNPSTATGRLWAADNGAFSGFDARAFEQMMDGLAGRPGCLFVVAPDVVADSNATANLYRQWAATIRQRFPVAFVAQDGLASESECPWDEMDALFIGGTTEFKLGLTARAIAVAAKTRGKWLHMGRVNTRQRFRYAAAIGCDSVDGTAFSMYPDIKIPKALAWLSESDRQPSLGV